MGKPGVPSYGKDFTLEHLECDAKSQMAPRRYVHKKLPANYIRSSFDSKKWYIFYYGGLIATHPTMAKALSSLRNAIAEMDGE